MDGVNEWVWLKGHSWFAVYITFWALSMRKINMTVLYFKWFSSPKNEMHLLTSCDSRPMEACFLRVKNDKVLAIFYLFCTIVILYVAILNVYLIIASLYLTMWLNFAVSDLFS